MRGLLFMSFAEELERVFPGAGSEGVADPQDAERLAQRRALEPPTSIVGHPNAVRLSVTNSLASASSPAMNMPGSPRETPG